LKIVEAYFENETIDRNTLFEAATEFARSRGTHSGRTAYQFYRAYRQ